MKWIPLFFVFIVSGCGTVSTVYRSDQYAVSELTKSKTLCTKLPRIYSGVYFNLCQVHSNSENPFRYITHSFYLFDTIPSALTDTAILPYTIYKQNEKGGLTISK